MPVITITPMREEDVPKGSFYKGMFMCPVRRAPPPWDDPDGDDRSGGQVIVHIPLDARKNQDYWIRKRISLYCE